MAMKGKPSRRIGTKIDRTESNSELIEVSEGRAGAIELPRGGAD
jgi:hypothetical protein